MVKAKALRSVTKKATTNFDAARRKTLMKAARKLTEVVDGHHRFREEPPLLSRVALTDEYSGRVQKAFAGYRATLQNDRRRLLERFHMVDMAQKVVGVGNVGTRAGILLREGRDTSDPLIMQFKQATTSVLEPYLGASPTSQHGQRVVEGQRYMQTASDIFLGWVRGEGGRDFYVRQLHDTKGSADIEMIQPLNLAAYARLCGAALARAHARGGDVIALDAYIGIDETFTQVTEEFAQVYADQAEQDYGQLKEAISGGKSTIQEGI